MSKFLSISSQIHPPHISNDASLIEICVICLLYILDDPNFCYLQGIDFRGITFRRINFRELVIFEKFAESIFANFDILEIKPDLFFVIYLLFVRFLKYFWELLKL